MDASIDPGTSIAITGILTFIKGGILQMVSEPTLAVTWACEGQWRTCVAWRVWPGVDTTWQCAGTGRTDVCQEGTFLAWVDRRGRRSSKGWCM